MKRLEGYDALEAIRGGTVDAVNKYNDPIEPAREGLSLHEAEDVAREDAGLLWVEIPDHHHRAQLEQGGQRMETDWTIDTYTAQFDAAMQPPADVEEGDTVRFPTDESCDGRELDGLMRRMRACLDDERHRAELDFDFADGGWDYFTIVRNLR